MGLAADARGQRGPEACQPELGQRDVLVRDGLAQAEASRPLERLGDADAPSDAVADEAAAVVGRALLSDAPGDLRQRLPAGGPARRPGGIELGLIEAELRVLDRGFPRQRGGVRGGGGGRVGGGGAQREHQGE